MAAKGFELQVDAYEIARPSYPPAVIQALESALELVPHQSQVLDLAAGTGKMTRLLASRYPVVAVEPAKAMRDKFQQILPQVPIYNGTAWDIPVESESQDAVVAAQAFHWFANVKALEEIRRVLKPGGWFCMIWNLEDRDAAQWVADLRGVYEVHENKTPQYRHMEWRLVWQEPRAKELFGDLQEQSFYHDQLLADEEVWQRTLSKSYISCLDNDAKAALKQKIFTILANAKDLARNETGAIKCPYKTNMFWAQRK